MRNRDRIKFLVLLLLTFISVVCLYHIISKHQSVKLEECQTDNIVTVREGGRLGNCVWEYIAVLGIHDALGLSPFVPSSILKCLGKVFTNLRIPAYENTVLSEKCMKIHGGDSERCKSRDSNVINSKWDRLCNELKYGDAIQEVVAYQPISVLRELKESRQLPSILVLPKWIAHHHAFAHIGLSRVKQELQFRKDVKELAEETLRGVRRKHGNQETIFVGIHVRRKDYLSYVKKGFGEKWLADEDYYKQAMKRMREVLNNSSLVYVVVSDDYDWCKKYLVNEKEGVYWGGLEHSDFIRSWKDRGDMGIGHDLAVLALQNHSIIGYGTYAMTGSLLTGGHIIALDISKNKKIKDYLTVRLCKILSNCELL